MIPFVIDNQHTRLADVLNHPPFSARAMECAIGIVGRIIEMELPRGEIGRAQRSALDPRAPPLPNLRDWMIYRMAGLADKEAKGLQDRVTRML